MLAITMKTLKTGLLAFCLTLLTLGCFAADADQGTVVDATFQERTSFAGADAQVVFLDNSITTLGFRIYDNAFFDAPPDKGAFDGKPGSKPRIDPGAIPDSVYRDNLKLIIGTSSSITLGNRKVIPVYQTKAGSRIYYIVDSYKDNGDSKRFSFLVLPPSAK